MVEVTALLQLPDLKDLRAIFLAVLPASNPCTICSHLSPLHLLSFSSDRGNSFFPSSGWPCADTWNHSHCQLLNVHFNLLCLLFISSSHQATSQLRSHRNWSAFLREHVKLHTLCLPNSGNFIPGQSQNHAEVEGWTWGYLFLSVQKQKQLNLAHSWNNCASFVPETYQCSPLPRQPTALLCHLHARK